MRKSAMLLVCSLMLFSIQVQAQDIYIGKEDIVSPDIPIRPGNLFNYQYNQFIYKQQWIHAQGSINKIAYYYNGNSTASYNVAIYMGHTSRSNFVNRQYISVNELTLVYDGPFSFPGTAGWMEITLQTPFNYNNIDNLVIAIDKNSIDPQGADDSFSNSILDDDAASIVARDNLYNIDPANPQGIVGSSREIPNIKISGVLTQSPYIYFYGSKHRDISTDPNSAILINVETNLPDYNVENDQTWISTIKDIGAGTLAAKVISLNSTLAESKRSTRLVASGIGAKNDTVFVNQYMYESITINSVAFTFADYDNDNDFDLLGSFPEIGINQGNGSYSFHNLSIPNISSGITFWGDYDKDGDLDFSSIGYDPDMNKITKIFRNDGSDIFTDILSEQKVFQVMEVGIWSYASWCDYNNDGNPDLLITGTDIDISANTILYKNLGNDTFVNSGIVFPKLTRGNAEWGDYNNDGLIDIVMTGWDISGNSTTLLFKNLGNEKFTSIDANLLGLSMGNVDWGDYDNDGDLDLLSSGQMSNSSTYLKVYRNDGNDILTDINAGLLTDLPNWSQWADYDNDGDLDIISYSATYVGSGTLLRYKNEGNNKFVLDFSLTIPDYWQDARFSTGDYDKDGDLDFVIHHTYKSYSQIFRNNSNIPNNAPSIPIGLNTFRKGTRIYLTWNPASDTETPSKSLSYNVRVGTAPGKGDVVLPDSDPSTGFIKVPGMGNCSLDTLFILDNLPLGTYYWSVQSIDNMYAGSDFSTEQSFTVLPPFSKLTPGIATLFYASAAWGDYDNDNDMDLAITGRLTNYDGETTRIYKNNGDTTFTEIILNIQGRYSGSIAWGDYDNDNDLDLLISGKNSSGLDRAKIIRNDVNDQFTELPVTFSSTQFSSAIWGDVDNDGDVDISVNDEIYRNEGNGVFTEKIKSGGYADMTNNSFADYDNDKDLDFFVSSQWVKKELYSNTSGIFSRLTSNYAPLYWGSMDWGDSDNDGDLDLLISGVDTVRNNQTKICRNDRKGVFTIIDTELRGVSEGQARWGDFDNDGDPDIVLGGWSGSRILKVYGNKGNNTFEEIYDHPVNPDMITEQVNYAIWGDYNNDGNLDFIKNGLIFSNNYNTPHTAPDAPSNLKVSLTGFEADFAWEDLKNPVGVTYNLRLGTTSGGTQVVSPMSDIQSGYRKIPVMGNVQNNTSWVIKNLSPGVTYFWSVQTIDAGFMGSQWSPEQTFSVRNVYPEFISDTVCLGLKTSFTDKTISPSEPIVTWKWFFGNDSTSTLQNPVFIFPDAGSHEVKLVVYTSSFADSVVKTIVVKAKPNAEFSADTTCQGTATTLINNTTLNDLTPLSWQWDYGDGQGSLQQNPLAHGFLNAGTFNVRLKVTESNGCSDSIQKPVTVGSYPVAVITSDNPLMFCKGDSVVLSVGHNSNFTYQWQLDGTGITDADSSKLAVKLSGNYSVNVTNRTGNCLSTSSESAVTAKNVPASPVLGSDNFQEGKCPGENPIKISVDQEVSEYSYQWFRNGAPLSNSKLSYIEGMLKQGDYSLIAELNGCSSTSEIFQVAYQDAPETPLIIPKGPTVWYLICNNTTANSYKWYYNGALIPEANDYTYLANQKLGKYNVSVSNAKGCYTLSDTVMIPNGLTGIEDTDPFENVKIYPNPTTGMFTIEMNNNIYGEMVIDIFSQNGRKMLNIKFEKTTEHFSSQIDLAGQSSGMYIINLSIDKFRAVRKVVVE